MEGMKSFSRRATSLLLSMWSNITVEPVMALYAISSGLALVIRPNLIIDKACLQYLNFSQEVCGDLLDNPEHKDQLGEVATVVSHYERNLSLYSLAPKILYSLLAGQWSDWHGRKPLIAITLIGQILGNISYVVNRYYLTELPFPMLYLEFIQEVCGEPIVFYIGLYAYIADVTDNSNM
jgi:MFS family permease